MIVWEGVYKSFAEVPVEGPGFLGDIWLDRSTEDLQRSLEVWRKRGSAPPRITRRQGPLPMAVAMLLTTQERVRVLDFGGGIGASFLQLQAELAGADRVEFHIVDNPRVTERARTMLAEFPRLHFHDSIPVLENIDVVHLGSSLQYVEPWPDVLARIADLRPRIIAFTDLKAGNTPTYATGQRYYGSTIPCWFFNLDEVLATLARLGYDAIHQAPFQGPVLGKTDGEPQDNFPPSLRIGHSCNLVLLRRAPMAAPATAPAGVHEQ